MKYMIHMIEIEKIHVDSTITIEMNPDDQGITYALLLDHEYIPNINQYEHAAAFSLDGSVSTTNTSFKWNSDVGAYEWFIGNHAIANRTGRWILTVMTLKELLNANDLEAGKIDVEHVQENISGDYSLRSFHSGCYYFSRKQYSWVADGVKVSKNDYGSSLCRASHLTSFAAGFFPTPNTIDFEFVFAEAAFTDNLTIYLTIIISLLLYLLLTIWSYLSDKEDRKRLRSLALPDNNSNHHYIYEILTFTGHWEGSSCDSAIYFEITGDNSSTGLRNLDTGRKDTLRKGTTDSYIMKTAKYVQIFFCLIIFLN